MYTMGQRVKFGEANSVGYITYPYTGGEILAVTGLGKKNSFPIPSYEVNEVKDQESYLSKFHKSNSILWVDKTGNKFYYSTPAEFELNGEILAKGPNVYFKYRVLITEGEVEFLDRVDVTFCYQLRDLIKIAVFDEDIKDDTLKNYIEAFNMGASEDIIEVKFVELESTVKEDIYFGEERYYTILEVDGPSEEYVLMETNTEV